MGTKDNKAGASLNVRQKTSLLTDRHRPLRCTAAFRSCDPIREPSIQLLIQGFARTRHRCGDEFGCGGDLRAARDGNNDQDRLFGPSNVEEVTIPRRDTKPPDKESDVSLDMNGQGLGPSMDELQVLAGRCL
jgi:hypothetical protein